MNALALAVATAAVGLLPVGSPAPPASIAPQDPVLTPAAAGALDGLAQPRRPVPWSVGERLEYDVTYGRIRAGSGLIEVRGIEQVRGRPAYHIVFQVRGGIPLYRVNDVFESWMDTTSLASLRYVSDQDEGPRERQRHYEIYPDRQVYTEGANGGPELPSVPNAVDDASFLYFLRTVPLQVGQTYNFNNYFRPDRNPVTIRVLRRERVTVPAGTYDAIVVQPTIKTRSGIFGEGGRAEVWLSDDDQRIVLQLRSKLAIGSLNLFLKSHRRGSGAGSAGS